MIRDDEKMNKKPTEKQLKYAEAMGVLNRAAQEKMHLGICKICGGNFWESYKGARGEDLCDGCDKEGEAIDKAIQNTPNLRDV